MEGIQQIEVKGIRVLTTKQIAMEYGVAEKLIRNNFENNKSRYELGKHYIYLVGEELQTFLHTQSLRLQNQNKVRKLYLWTEKGALLHAKSLNTDKAWEVYDYLVDHYFRVKDATRQQDSKEVVPVNTKVEPVPEAIAGRGGKSKVIIPEINQPVKVFHTLLDLAEQKHIRVLLLEMKSLRSGLNSGTIGIRANLPFNEIVYELAYELAHAMVHYDAGNMVESPLCKEYNAFAERMACMMIELLNTQMEKVG